MPIEVTVEKRGSNPFRYALRLSQPVDQQRLMALIMWGDLRRWGVDGIEGRDSARTLAFNSTMDLSDAELESLLAEFGKRTGYEFQLAA